MTNREKMEEVIHRSLHNPGHPFWHFSRFTITMVALTITLWLSASDFDHTELQTLLVAFGVMSGSEIITKLIPGKKEEKKE